VIEFDDGSEVDPEEFRILVRDALSEGPLSDCCPDVSTLLRHLDVANGSYREADAIASNESVRVWLGKHSEVGKQLQTAAQATRGAMLRNVVTRNAEKLPGVDLDAVDWERIAAVTMGQ
jgi:hypothetical protein